MYYLAVAVVVAVILTVANLILTFGVIRKLRAHDALLSSVGPGFGGFQADVTVPVGATVATAQATTVDGRSVSTDWPSGPRLVGFFSPGCQPCEERIPEFLQYRERTGIATIAVVVSDGDDSEQHVSRLSGQGDVIVEPTGGPFGSAFQVTSFPALCLVDRDGVVLGTGNAFTDLPELQTT